MKKARMIIDILMTLLLPVLMAYSLVGEQAHEILGLCMFALFIAHHVINRKWWTGLFKGKYNAVRVLNTLVNLFLAVFMVMQPVSGVLMSKYILKNVTIAGKASVMRTIHMELAYWGFVMMSFHLGLHVRTISARVSSGMKPTVKNALSVVFLIAAGYGVYAFIKRGISDYLMMKTAFAFFDMSEPKIWFFLDYIAMMVLFAEAGYLIQKGLLHMEMKGKRGARNGE